MTRFLLLFLLMPIAAYAEYLRLPAAYIVSGNDKVSVRPMPDAGSTSSGSLELGKVIEVLSLDPSKEWARIKWTHETNGWVSMQNLSPFTVVTDPHSGMPMAMHCSAWEPSWSARIFPNGQFSFDAGDSGRFSGSAIEPIKSITNSANVGPSNFAFTTQSFSALLRRDICYASGSAFMQGWALDLIDHRGERLQLVGGCCVMVLP